MKGQQDRTDLQISLGINSSNILNSAYAQGLLAFGHLIAVHTEEAERKIESLKLNEF